VFRSQPFRELDEPRRYVAWAFAQEAAADVRFGEPIVAVDRAVVEYWAVSRSDDGAEETIAGASLLRFGTDGLVVEQHDYWNIAPGRHEAPRGWGT
jgi:SnoaL-like domain